MTSEIEWRRKWKRNLLVKPWIPISVTEDDSHTYLLKSHFTENSYELLVTDLVSFWHEELGCDEIRERNEVKSIVFIIYS